MNRFHAFNRYFLSHSAQDYSKGDRVICNLGTSKNPKFFIGTVTMNRLGLVHVLLDNEERVKFKPTSSMAGLIGVAKKTTKRKAEIPASDIKTWINLPSSTTTTKIRTIPKKPKNKEIIGYFKKGTPEQKLESELYSLGMIPDAPWAGKSPNTTEIPFYPYDVKVKIPELNKILKRISADFKKLGKKSTVNSDGAFELTFKDNDKNLNEVKSDPEFDAEVDAVVNKISKEVDRVNPKTRTKTIPNDKIKSVLKSIVETLDTLVEEEPYIYGWLEDILEIAKSFNLSIGVEKNNRGRDTIVISGSSLNKFFKKVENDLGFFIDEGVLLTDEGSTPIGEVKGNKFIIG